MKPFITIREIEQALAKKECSVVEVVDYFRARIAAHDPQLKAFLEVFANDIDYNALPQAGMLRGVPGIIKDNICQHGHIASAGSRILANYRAPYDAAVTTRIKEEGGIILGRGNMDEFAMGASGEFSGYQLTLNPWDHNRSPGGSSAGPAAAVAAGMVPWALGTETGGSVRQPAAFCSLVGLYPTYGLVPRYGIVAFGSSLDQVGPLTRTVYDNALVLSVIAGHDARDASSLPEPRRDYTRRLDGKLPDGLRIGVLQEGLQSEGIHPDIRAALEHAVSHFENLGATITYLDVESIRYGIAVYFIISRAEAASNLARYDGSLFGDRIERDTLLEMYQATRTQGFGAEVKRRILMGNYVLSAGHKDAFYGKASQVRSLIRSELDTTFDSVDVLLAPTTATLPFALGKESTDPLAMYMGDYFTVANCVAGFPGLSFPAGFSREGLPIGIQFIGPRLSEELMYRAAYAFEQSQPFHLKHPPEYA